MESSTLLSALITIGVGTFSGGITNAVAIWMLFNPHEPFRFGPFSFQGALPKNKERLAKAIGKTVGQKLLTPEDLAERLSAAPIREAGIPVLAVPGNHEYWLSPRSGLRNFQARFPLLEKRRWSFLGAPLPRRGWEIGSASPTWTSSRIRSPRPTS